MLRAAETAMNIDRRTLLMSGAAALLPLPVSANDAQQYGLDAAHLGVRPGSNDDQTRALQRAIDQAAQKKLPLWLPPGVYRAAALKLPAGVQISGVRGQTRLALNNNAPMFESGSAENLSLNSLTLDGGKIRLPDNNALIQLAGGRDMHINDCEIVNAGGHGIRARMSQGQITNNTVESADDTAIFSIDGINMLLAGNTIRNSGNGGIRIWQTNKNQDGAIVVDNQIENTNANAGGSGQNGNAINIFRAGNVIVRGNRIKKTAFSAVRGNAANDIQIVANNCTDIGEVALYSEFEFENAIINGNTVDSAALGIAVTNFKEGGRLATVQGNVLRNINRQRPKGTDPNDGYGIGIGVEADTAVTGNVIENASRIGIAVGSGQYLRDCTVTGNVIRGTPTGIAVSVVKGAGAAVISQNVITGARRGAVVGTEWQQVVTADLALVAPGAYPQLTISGNQVR
jgi:uncharacterized secreted repeat protein (TIGR03808 family)